ncbi:hypothetical protein B0T24DRAFT_337761 [Lasiosphaeria ovina]|uniref:Uncharacterized protein n=1 Tax=Lasiosphaeria ovina TaxID=92902 RepID=A0AAE0K844_9PEZI|nr:hypothetical protein B0T24DRAFT_337761 [Lasiosphaeria ovina]
MNTAALLPPWNNTCGISQHKHKHKHKQARQLSNVGIELPVAGHAKPTVPQVGGRSTRPSQVTSPTTHHTTYAPAGHTRVQLPRCALRYQTMPHYAGGCWERAPVLQPRFVCHKGTLLDTHASQSVDETAKATHLVNNTSSPYHTFLQVSRPCKVSGEFTRKTEEHRTRRNGFTLSNPQFLNKPTAKGQRKRGTGTPAEQINTKLVLLAAM